MRKQKVIQKLAVANRGEVAVRIIRACRELGIKTVLLHSEPDRQSIAYRLSDEQVCIGPAPSSESYLNIENNIQGALSVGAHAIHPGFGFLSENADFAEACARSGLIFVGPSPEAIRLMGDKVAAKNLARAAGIPVIPGYEGDDSDLKVLTLEAEKIGYPIIVKASGGGGGRGLKVVRSAGELVENVQSAQREAKGSFGSSRVFLEKYFEDAKHIEFQVFGDSHGQVVHLFERECSVQRRHQKIIEEAPSGSLTLSLRAQMGEVARRLAEKVKYEGAGTVEFLLSQNKFYFMEMNTRLQVEHPVTEMVTGVDLVKAQIQVARGEPLPWTQDSIQTKGHSLECRLYAEDPYDAGRPSTGVLGSLDWPMGPGRRYDLGFETRDEITPHYDPMIGKLIVWDESRSRACTRMLEVLGETVVFGVRTNIPLLREIISHPEFVSVKFNTQFISKYFPAGLSKSSTSDELKERITQEIVKLASKNAPTKSQAGPVGSERSPWREGWRIT